MGHILSKPVTSKFVQRRGHEWLRVGAAEMQGYRINMEDEHVIEMNIAKKGQAPLALFGVFDGHSGAAASAFMKKELANTINKLVDPMNPKLLQEAVMKLDADFLESDAETNHHGTTACIVLTSPVTASSSEKEKARYKIVVANVGDSRALLITKEGILATVTKDHKPDDAEEAKRIRSAGGRVSFGRVDGELAMSRSIGDFNYKSTKELSAEQQKVIALPDVQIFEAGWGDRLVVCCDGLVERLTNEQIAAFVHCGLNKYPNDPAYVMSLLCDYSLVRGSKDNMSALVCILGDGRDYGVSKEWKADEYLPGSYNEAEDNPKFSEAFRSDAQRHGIDDDELNKLLKLSDEKKQRETDSDQMHELSVEAAKFSNATHIQSAQQKALREIDDSEDSVSWTALRTGIAGLNAASAAAAAAAANSNGVSSSMSMSMSMSEEKGKDEDME